MLIDGSLALKLIFLVKNICVKKVGVPCTNCLKSPTSVTSYYYLYLSYTHVK
ncbi:unnamed protein product [Tenebrio molitor]|nr:unnamed protein product [Tenebrio molitor]